MKTKSYKDLFNEWAQQTDVLYELSLDERQKLQDELLKMYIDIDKLCTQNGLLVMLGGGSCLGAVRHKGFIPWDDDLDLMMGRPDYDALICLLKKGALSDKYEFRYPDGKMFSSSAFLKIYKKGTSICTSSKYPEGIFIDVFPIEGVSNNGFAQKIIGIVANGLRLISNCIDELYMNDKILSAILAYPPLARRIRIRRVIGRIFSIIGSRRLRFWFDQIVKNDDLSGLTCVPTSRKLYGGEIQDHSFKFPAILVPFESYMAKIPANYDAYLSDMYGNYMEVPPVEKRERHFYEKLIL